MYQPSICICVCLWSLRTEDPKKFLKASISTSKLVLECMFNFFLKSPDGFCLHISSIRELITDQGSSFHGWTTRTVRKFFLKCVSLSFSPFCLSVPLWRNRINLLCSLQESTSDSQWPGRKVSVVPLIISHQTWFEVPPPLLLPIPVSCWTSSGFPHPFSVCV